MSCALRAGSPLILGRAVCGRQLRRRSGLGPRWRLRCPRTGRTFRSSCAWAPRSSP